jgi:hypothetical protein
MAACRRSCTWANFDFELGHERPCRQPAGDQGVLYARAVLVGDVRGADADAWPAAGGHAGVVQSRNATTVGHSLH